MNEPEDVPEDWRGVVPETAAVGELDAIRALLAEAIVLRATSGRPEERAASRAESLELLAELAASLRFTDADAAFGPHAPGILDAMTTVLTLHPDAPIDVAISGTELPDREEDRVLRRKRARALVTALVARGLDFSRFSIDVDDESPDGADRDGAGPHRVRIAVDDPERR